jgi:hypothetical protein
MRALLWLYTCHMFAFVRYMHPGVVVHRYAAGPMHIYMWMHAQRMPAQNVEASNGKAQSRDGM